MSIQVSEMSLRCDLERLGSTTQNRDGLLDVELRQVDDAIVTVDGGGGVRVAPAAAVVIHQLAARILGIGTVERRPVRADVHLEAGGVTELLPHLFEQAVEPAERLQLPRRRQHLGGNSVGLRPGVGLEAQRRGGVAVQAPADSHAEKHQHRSGRDPKAPAGTRRQSRARLQVWAVCTGAFAFCRSDDQRLELTQCGGVGGGAHPLPVFLHRQLSLGERAVEYLAGVVAVAVFCPGARRLPCRHVDDRRAQPGYSTRLMLLAPSR